MTSDYKLILYVRTSCHYCEAVIRKLKELGLTWEEKNVADPKVAEELIRRGGEKKEPYLIDSDSGLEMYESSFIISYLERTFGGKKQG